MEAMIAASFKAWDPSCFILDLRKLTYEWGDMMTALFDPPHDLISTSELKVEFPFAAVVSELNREGLTSLIKQEMQADPEKILFDNIDDACARVVEMARKTYELA